ncbi:MAG TPA: endonuclease MutS2 [Bacteroidetes bacterium]|nr:endonuclease MutS2 [Bacteroidota bacterium]
MQLEPKDLYEKLEFDKILALLEAACYGGLGKAAVRDLPIMTDTAVIERQLNETWEYKTTLEQNDPFPLATYEDLSEDLKLLDIEDYVLPQEAWQRINSVLVITGDIFHFFNADRKKVYPYLHDIIRPVEYDATLSEAIQKVFDEEGNIRPDASPALGKIRRGIVNRQRDMDKLFRQLIQNYRDKGWLTDSVESIRNGRRVLSAPAEHKRKIRGIIHDESATGRTSFIEPEQVIEINNDIFDLQQEERREIRRILKDLSATFRPYTPQIRTWQQLLVRLDVVHAKARLASQMNAYIPRLKKVDEGSNSPTRAGGIPHLGIQMARHPLLFLKNKKEGKETVPFDLTLLGNNRIIVLSGPNAGGKSILMKSVGLLQLMVQSGMLVPMDEISEMGIFEKIFADIGDQQSIEDDLSTYSSRLANMRTFLDHADKNSLILIDEFGSGTDPKMGGAIAEAILKELNERRVFGVITTHYSNLKMFAFKTRGIVNGSMLFDKEHLSPTYMFKVGRPGSSYAFEIAQKSGLPKKVLSYARRRTGKSETAVDDLLIDLQAEKKEVEDKLASMKEREKKLERLIKNYEDLHRDLEYRRKKQKLDAKQAALQDTARDNRELQRVIREIRESQNLEKAKSLASQSKQERKQLEETINTLAEEVYEVPKPKFKDAKKGEIAVGDFVKMRAGEATGTVESITKKKAIIQVGQIRMTVKLRDLVHAREPLDVNATTSIKTDTFSQNATFDPKLDIRGMTMTDAHQIVQDFLDRALLTSSNSLRIVHGKGSGVLRNVVREKLREYQEVKNMYHPAQKDGGDGVTIVEF